VANERTNTTSYTHPQENNLLNVHKAMEYNSLGQPIVRTLNSISEISATIDAFGRQRFSQPYTIANYSHVYGEEEEMITVTSGSGTSTGATDKASIELSVGTGDGDYVKHQTRQHHEYQPGKSQLVMMSFNFVEARANTVKRVGYFNERNGVWLQLNGDGTLSLFKRSYATGSAVDTEITQANFSQDKLDGTGASGFSYDVSKSQLLMIDFQWLGVGKIRVGLVQNGTIVYFHQFSHANQSLGFADGVYWSNPALPVRCEVLNTGVAVGTTRMLQTCATVMSEGGEENTGTTYSASNRIRSPKVWSNGQIDKRTPLIAIRLKNSFASRPNRGTVRLSDYTAHADSASFRIEIWRLTSADRLSRADSSAPTWTSAGNYSIVEYSTDAQFLETGDLDKSFRIDTYFVAANNPSGKQSAGTGTNQGGISKRDFIAQNFDSDDSQVFVLCATSLTTTASNCWGAINWRETK
jgi:hypothetical protein